MTNGPDGKENIRTHARTRTYAKPHRGIAAFIAFQGLLALARGETRFPPGSSLYHPSSFLAALVAHNAHPALYGCSV